MYISVLASGQRSQGISVVFLDELCARVLWGRKNGMHVLRKATGSDESMLYVVCIVADERVRIQVILFDLICQLYWYGGLYVRCVWRLHSCTKQVSELKCNCVQDIKRWSNQRPTRTVYECVLWQLTP